MALTVTPTNHTSIHECNATTGWTGSNVAAVTDFFKRGTACVGFILRTSGNNLCFATGSWNLNTTRTLRMWYMCAAFNNLLNQSNGGIQFYVMGGGIEGYWTVGGGDTYPGGWHNYAVDLGRPPDEGAMPVLTSVTRVGFRQKMGGTIKNAQNTWVDFFHCSDGLNCSASTGTFGILDIFTRESTSATGGWGVVNRIGGVYFLTGELLLNNFYDTAESIVFEDRPVRTDLYRIRGSGNIRLGDEVGGSGVSGLNIRTQRLIQNAKFGIVPSANLSHDFKSYGTFYIDTAPISLLAGNPNCQVYNSAFESSGEVSVLTTKIRNTNFISAKSTGAAVRIPSNNVHDMLNCNFINNAVAVTIPTAGTYTFDRLFFSGNVVDINNTSGGLVTVNCTGGSNPSPAKVTGNTVIVNTVNLTLSNLVANSRIRIMLAGTQTVLTGTDSSGTTFQYSYSYSPGTQVDIVVHHRHYVHHRINNYVLSAQNASIPVSQRRDRIFIG